MKKIFKKEKELYKIVFCDENDINTKFYEYATFETYEQANHCIRMGWRKNKKDKIENGYKIKDAWILIEKFSKKG